MASPDSDHLPWWWCEPTELFDPEAFESLSEKLRAPLGVVEHLGTQKHLDRRRRLFALVGEEHAEERALALTSALTNLNKFGEKMRDAAQSGRDPNSMCPDELGLTPEVLINLERFVWAVAQETVHASVKMLHWGELVFKNDPPKC